MAEEKSVTGEKTIILVDGSSLAFRMFYALMRTGMRAKDGTPTYAVHGFFSAIFDLIEKQKPDMLAVCFDLPEPTFRHTEFAYYKANRDEMPDDLARQWPIIKEGVKALEIPLYELAGYEADDVIGTLAKLAEKDGARVLILTGDQDAFQLLEGDSQRVQVLMPKDGQLINFDRHKVFEKLAVWPEQIIDYKGLSGDSSDNIPGVKGIGPKTAATLLASYGSIDGIYEHIDEIKGAVKQKLIDGRQSAMDSKRLATIKLDVPMEFDFAHCHLTMPDLYKAKEFFTKLNFKQLTVRLQRVLGRFDPNGIEPDLSTILIEDMVAPMAAAAANPMAAAAALLSGNLNPAIAAAAARLQAAAEAAESAVGNNIQTAAGAAAIFAGDVLTDMAGAAETLGMSTSANGPTGSATASSGAGGATKVTVETSTVRTESTQTAGGQLTLSFSYASDSNDSNASAAASPTAVLDPIKNAELIDSEAKLDTLIEELSKQSLISVDLETTGLNALDTEIVGYAIAYDPTMILNEKGLVENDGGTYGAETLKAVYIPVRHAGLSPAEQLAPDFVSAKLKPILEDRKIGKVAQNGKYEMNVLSLDGIHFGPVCFDPMLASYIVNPDQRHGLKEQAERILG
ncbi:MAG: hypothetical protein KGS72_26670, partial [Cyanobacteria bacterium REEB67]|nr:hypothetical protein [Cyanobacteria bacterium REEB67]